MTLGRKVDKLFIVAKSMPKMLLKQNLKFTMLHVAKNIVYMELDREDEYGG